MTTAYQEVQEMIKIEELFGSASSLKARKTKLYNLGNLINTLMEEVDMIDAFCEKRVGPNCDIPTCFGKYHQGSLYEEPCNSNGKCIDVDKCQCNKGYHGHQCQYFECFGVPSNETSSCNGNGRCLSMNFCKCNIDFGGVNCNQTIPLNFPIQVDSNHVNEPLFPQGYIPKSCREYFEKSEDTLSNGYFKIRPYYISNETLIVYCDMKKGGYTLLDESIFKHMDTLLKGAIEIRTSYGARCFSETILDAHSDFVFQVLCRNIGAQFNMRTKMMEGFFSSPFKYWVK